MLPCVRAAVQQYPPQVTMLAAEMESKMVLFDVAEQVLAATGLKPCEVRAVLPCCVSTSLPCSLGLDFHSARWACLLCQRASLLR